MSLNIRLLYRYSTPQSISVRSCREYHHTWLWSCWCRRCRPWVLDTSCPAPTVRMPSWGHCCRSAWSGGQCTGSCARGCTCRHYTPLSLSPSTNILEQLVRILIIRYWLREIETRVIRSYIMKRQKIFLWAIYFKRDNNAYTYRSGSYSR